MEKTRNQANQISFLIGFLIYGKTALITVLLGLPHFVTNSAWAESSSEEFQLEKIREDAMAEFNRYCEGTKPSPSFNEKNIRTLFRNKLFPGAEDSLGVVLDRIDNWKSPTIPGSTCLPLSMRATPAPSKLLSEILRGATDDMVEDLQVQTNMLEKAQDCSAQILKFADRQKIVSFEGWTKREYDLAKKELQSPVCFEIVDRIIPELIDRFHQMKIYLAIATRKYDSGEPLFHERPGLMAIIRSTMSTSWKSDSTDKVSPLTDEEYVAVKDHVANNLSPSEALRRYKTYLSSAPILSLFSDVPTPRSFAEAMSATAREKKLDLQSYKKDPPQEVTLLLPYIKDRINKLPKEKKGDACFVISQIHKNLMDRQSIRAGIYNMMLFFGMGGAVGRIGVGPFTKIILAGSLGSAPAIKNAILEFDQYTQMCNRILLSNNANIESKERSLCSFAAADKVLDEVGRSAFIDGAATIFGVPGLRKLLVGGGLIYGEASN